MDGTSGRAPAPREHLTSLAAAFLHVTPAPERVLDLGTGTGEAALLAAREFPRASVRGIDVSEEMVAVAKKKVGLDPDGRIAFKVADAARIPWPDDSFDLVMQMNVPPFFAEIARVLRPGGSVVVAASWGAETPFYTPDSVLERGFAKHGIDEHVTGEAGPGTYWVGRRLPTNRFTDRVRGAHAPPPGQPLRGRRADAEAPRRTRRRRSPTAASSTRWS